MRYRGGGVIAIPPGSAKLCRAPAMVRLYEMFVVIGCGGAAVHPRGEGTTRQYMGSISRYIIRSTLGAFLLVLVSLTSVIWVTHILRDIDLVTTQGQTAVVFVGITLLLVPALGPRHRAARLHAGGGAFAQQA